MAGKEKKEKSSKKEKKEKPKKRSFGLGRFLKRSESPRSPPASPRQLIEEDEEPVRPTITMDLSHVTQDTERCITRLQAYARGYVTRKAIEEQGSRAQLYLQRRAITDLVKVERKYVEHLSIILDEYLAPVRATKLSKKGLKTVKEIFVNIEEVHQLHQNVLALFERNYERWPNVQTFGQELSRMVAKFTVYEDYVRGLPESKKLQKDLEKDKDKIMEQIIEIDQERKRDFNNPGHLFRDLRALMRMPLKQLNQYKRGLKKMMTNTSFRYKDYGYRVAVAAAFRQTAVYVNARYEEHTARQELLIAENRLLTKTGFSLRQKRRKLVRQGELQVNGKALRQVMLFNDICVVAKIVNPVTFAYIEHFELKGCRLQRLYTSEDGTKQVFTVTTRDDSVYTFAPKSTHAKKTRSWQRSFEDVLAKRNAMVFGVKVEDLVQREGAPIPKILMMIAYRLNRGLCEEKVFRSAGDYRQMSSLKRRFNNHKTEVDLSLTNAQSAAALLVPYLESLPDPIFDLDVSHEIVYRKSEIVLSEVCTFFREGMNKLPLSHQYMFEYITFLLHRAAKKSMECHQYPLTTTELSVLFSPLLFNPSKMNMAYCLRMPRIVKLYKMILEQPEALFVKEQGDHVPESIKMFLYSDQFGTLWRHFRAEKKCIIDYLSKPENISQLIERLEVVREDPEDVQQSAYGAALSVLVLTSDPLMPTIVASKEHLLHIWKCLEKADTRNSERTLCFFKDTVLALFESHAAVMTDFVLSNSGCLDLVLSLADRGNIASMLSEFARLSLSHGYDKYHRLLGRLAERAFTKVVASASGTDPGVEALESFLLEVLQDHIFLRSEHARPFEEALSCKDTIRTLVGRVLGGGDIPAGATHVSAHLMCALLTKCPVQVVMSLEDAREMKEEEDDDTSSSSGPVSSLAPAVKAVVTSEPLPSLVGTLVAVSSEFGGQIHDAIRKLVKVAGEPFSMVKLDLLHFVRALAVADCRNSADTTPGISALSLHAIPRRVAGLLTAYPNNSIVLCVVGDIFCEALDMYNDDLDTLKVILKSNIAGNIAELANNDQLPLGCVGQAMRIANVIESTPLARQIVRGSAAKTAWEQFVNCYLARFNKDSEVSELQRKTTYDTMGASDRYEDRI